MKEDDPKSAVYIDNRGGFASIGNVYIGAPRAERAGRSCRAEAYAEAYADAEDAEYTEFTECTECSGRPEPAEEPAAPAGDTRRGRRQEPLFADGRGEKDEARTRAAVQQLTERLRERLPGQPLTAVVIDASKGNPLNALFLDCYLRWRHAGWLPAAVNAAACFRFLRDDCGIAAEVEPKAWGNWMRGQLQQT